MKRKIVIFFTLLLVLLPLLSMFSKKDLSKYLFPVFCLGKILYPIFFTLLISSEGSRIR